MARRGKRPACFQVMTRQQANLLAHCGDWRTFRKRRTRGRWDGWYAGGGKRAARRISFFSFSTSSAVVCGS